MRKTKIVATISSREASVDFITRLYKAGMNVARLNTAHLSHDQALEVINNIRGVSPKIGILLDTKGPEIRTCHTDRPLTVAHGDYVRIKGAPKEISLAETICVSYPHFAEDVPVGSSILIDDGCIALTVVKKEGESLICHVENDGTIEGKKSVNIPSVHVKLPALSEKDMGFIEFAADHDLDFIAHSFVRSKTDVIEVQKILDRKKSAIKIIAKIENSEGVKNLDEILEHAYGIMIARGDLAVEIPTEQIPMIQKEIIRTCIVKRRPVIVATQMLHSMINSPRPTRAEVSDVANACLDHVDAVMLSGETANGKYPEEAVRTMAAIAQDVEEKRSTFNEVPYTKEDRVTAYLAKAAVKAGLRLQTRGIVADTVTGRAIRALAAYRGDNVIHAQVYEPRGVRELSLSYGVNPDFVEQLEDGRCPLKKAVARLVDEKEFKEDDLIIILAGSFGPAQGASYIEIAPAGKLKADDENHRAS
ncbi:MAG: pyruvate kinase [Desulfobacterales bacterium]|nr:pyruvate kinase [Desulfobacterales bacterium]